MINSMFWHHSFTCPHILNYFPTVFIGLNSIIRIFYLFLFILQFREYHTLINQIKLCLVGKTEEVVRMEWNQITIVLKTKMNM
jgi:hypothetical protein